MYYFIYKYKKDESGGKFPFSKFATLGIASNNGWFLGSTEDPNLLYELQDFIIVPITADEAEGFKMLNAERKCPDDYLDDSECSEFTETDLVLIKKAKRLLNKLSVRSSIEFEIFDVYDSVSDINKKVEILAHVVYALADNILNSTTIPSNMLDIIQYKIQQIQESDISSILVSGDDTILDLQKRLDDRESVLKDKLQWYKSSN